ncbi:hypothetical protein CPB86DRAFT_563169 [Serendipita vermifera]|nr:hypothetical protein CPB86DRAFT_563169 [Serendipita vermifera]
MVQQQSELYGPPHSGLPPGSMPGQPPPGAGPTAGPMEGVRYATMPPGMQQMQQMHQMHQMHQQRIPTQAPGQPAPLQPQLTGGSMQGGQPMQLAPQHTGGSIQGGQPLVPQHTGGSVQGGQGEMMVGATGPGPVPGRASVPPSTPRNVVIRPPGMPFTNAPPMGVGPGPVSMGAPPHIMGPSMGMTMVPPGMGSMVEMRPPPGPHPMRSLPMEVNEIGMNVATMPPGPRRHNFGVLRLLQFSSQLGNINERKSDFWSTVIANNFTDTATLSIRSHKDTGLKLNSFVEVPFALLTRFFLTLSQSRVHRMSFVLDGAIETQEGQDYIVSCRHAKWPMYYENGYVIELTGVLIARCKVVPMLPAGYAIPSQSPPTGPDGAAAATKPNTASPNANASPANNSASPNSNNPNNPNLDPKLHSSAYKVPYIVKIDSLSFDSENVFKYVNVACIFKRPSTDPNEDIRIPEEPGNIYGIPVLTMRVIEFIEGSQALEPVMEHFGDEAKKGAHGPLEAMESLVKAFPPNYMMLNQQTIFPPPKPQPLGELARIFPPTPPIPFLAEPIKLEEDGYNMDPGGAHLNGDDSSSMQVDASGLPLGIPAGVQPSLTVMATPGSTSAPTASPTISTKTPGKKQAAPDSPTKSEKDKAPKRRNTTETTDLPPAKRTRTQGRKPSRA